MRRTYILTICILATCCINVGCSLHTTEKLNYSDINRRSRAERARVYLTNDSCFTNAKELQVDYDSARWIDPAQNATMSVSTKYLKHIQFENSHIGSGVLGAAIGALVMSPLGAFCVLGGLIGYFIGSSSQDDHYWLVPDPIIPGPGKEAPDLHASAPIRDSIRS